MRAGVFARLSQRTIARDLTLGLTIGIVAITCVASLVYGYYARARVEIALERQAEELAGRMARVLALPMWNVDTDTVTTVADAYYDAENVVGLFISDEYRDKVYSKSVVGGAGPRLTRHVPVRYKEREVGSIEIALAKGPLLKRHLEALYLVFMVMGGVIIGMAILTVTLLEPLLAKPIRRMTDGIATIAEGSYDHVLPTFKQADLNEIARQATTMAGQISERERRLEDLVKDLQERVAEKERAEAALLESKQRYEDLANLLPETVFETDEKGYFTYLNRNGFEAFGYDETDLRAGLHATEIFVPEERGRAAEAIRGILAGEQGRVNEYAAQREDGAVFPLLAHSRGIARDGKIIGLRGVLVDISERKKSEGELARLAAAVQQAAEAILVTDVTGWIEYVNPAFEKIFGLGRHAVLARSLSVLEGVVDEGFVPRVLQAIEDGSEWRGHIAGRHDGISFEVESTLSPVLDGRGRITNFVFVNRDVTEQSKLEKQLRQTQKLEALGTLAGGIAHDFNNILTPILGLTQTAMDELPEGSEARQDLRRVLSAGLRAKDLVSQILTFARQGENRRWAVQIGPIVHEVLKLLRASLPASIEIQRRIDEGVGAILCDPTQIHQVLLNLCTNASHAIGSAQGVLDVSLTEVMVPAEFAGQHPGLREGAYVRLTVGDTGCGMTREVLERIFEPFFTTKPPGEGTGMGLAVVHGIVRGHDGAIAVRSAPGEGTIVDVYFPKAEARLYGADESAEGVLRGSERILFVEDESEVAATVVRFLGALGYRVETAPSGVEGVERFSRRPDEFDLVISDLTMPGMNGVAFLGEVHRIRPETPAILCTGHHGGIQPEAAAEAGIREVVTKPLTAASLGAAVRRALREARGRAG
ncbi:MAG: PAS domain S-box protein [Deltaproteobacteria bacterium]|nr:PAS domain S-box protein [Deltaproteobacteria bacterium]